VATAYRWYREGKLPVPARKVGRLILVSPRKGGWPPVMARSQRAVRPPMAASPRNRPGSAAASGGKAPKTCLITAGR
jgi:hypothetical protein